MFAVGADPKPDPAPKPGLTLVAANGEEVAPPNGFCAAPNGEDPKGDALVFVFIFGLEAPPNGF